MFVVVFVIRSSWFDLISGFMGVIFSVSSISERSLLSMAVVVS